MNLESTQNNSFFFNYHRMGIKAYYDKVRFYEENKSHIHNLFPEERIDIDLDYLLCLFEIGKYNKFLYKVDFLIEIVIIDSIYTYNGMDIFRELLFKKAACLYNIEKFDASKKILKALIAINPDNNLARILFKKCKRRSKKWYNTAKAIVVTGLIISLMFSFFGLLIIKPFYGEFLSLFEMVKLSFFTCSIAILALNEFYLHYLIAKEIGLNFDFSFLLKKYFQ